MPKKNRDIFVGHPVKLKLLEPRYLLQVPLNRNMYGPIGDVGFWEFFWEKTPNSIISYASFNQKFGFSYHAILKVLEKVYCGLIPLRSKNASRIELNF